MKFTKAIIILSLIICYLNTKGQNANFVWAKQFASSASQEGFGLDIEVDALGNTYTTGWFRGTCDFDPGPGIYNLTSSGNEDVYICKLDASGNFVWARAIGGLSPDAGQSLDLDPFGNICLAGAYFGVVDFDPGPGTYTLSSVSGTSGFVLKLTSSGNFVWAISIGAGTNAKAISADEQGNIYATGYMKDTQDFDPGPGTYTLSSVGLDDIFVLKLDSSSNFVWARLFGGPSDESGYAIAVSDSGFVYTSGYFQGTADFDPGFGVQNLFSGGSLAVFISKLDNSGNFVWARVIDGGGSDIGNGIALDAVENVYVTGSFQFTADFDPGPNVFNLSAAGLSDIFISKLDQAGNFILAKRMGGMSYESGHSITVDSLQNIYTTGLFYNVSDFDPGPSTYNLATNGIDANAFISKLNSAGNFAWAKSITGVALNYDVPSAGYGIAVDGSYHVYTTGYFSQTHDFDPGPAVFTLTNGGQSDIFVHKMCQTPAKPASISGATIVCLNSTTIYSVTSVPGSSSFLWSLPPGWTGGPSTSSITSATSGSTGVFSITASNGCGLSLTQTLNVTVVGALSITISGPSSICFGQSIALIAGGAMTYSWNNGATTSTIMPTPSLTTTYMVSGYSGTCSSVAIKTITVNSLPLITVSSSNPVICELPLQPPATATLTASGASGYTWNPFNANGASISVAPLVSTVYSVTGSDAITGCVNNTTYTQVVSGLPQLIASSSPSVSCSGEPVTVIVTGVSNFTCNPGGNGGFGFVVYPTVSTTYTITGIDSLSGCTNTVYLNQDLAICTSVLNNSFNIRDIKIYPNPNAGEFNISADAAMAITITNELGQIKKTFCLIARNGHFEASISDFENGVYFVTGDFEGHTFKEKIVILK